LIFSLKEFNIGSFATVTGVLRIPKFKELKMQTLRVSDFHESPMSPDQVPYANKAKEERRMSQLQGKQEELKRKRAQVEVEKQERIQKQEEYYSKRAKKGMRRNKQAEERKSRQHEAEEIAKEVGLTRKFKRGKLTKEE